MTTESVVRRAAHSPQLGKEQGAAVRNSGGGAGVCGGTGEERTGGHARATRAAGWTRGNRMMSEAKLPALHVVGAVCWVVGIVFVGLDFGFDEHRFGHAGLLFAGLGLLANLKGMTEHAICKLERREKAAFNLGRESSRPHSVN